MFKKLFKKEKKINFSMPVTGQVFTLDKTPDEVFSSKMMGDGFCVMPEDGRVYSPVDGHIVSIFPTNHCVGLKDENGYEWLIHFGMDTVKLNGQGFKMHVIADQKVVQGDLLFEVDLIKIKPLIPSLITPVVLTNLGDKKIDFTFTGQVDCHDKHTIEIL